MQAPNAKRIMIDHVKRGGISPSHHFGDPHSDHDGESGWHQHQQGFWIIFRIKFLMIMRR